VLVHWCHEQASSVTWEDLNDFCSRFLDFQLEDELDLEGGCHVQTHLHQAHPRRAPGRRARDTRGRLGAHTLICYR
jgi:hypothetical protein